MKALISMFHNTMVCNTMDYLVPESSMVTKNIMQADSYINTECWIGC